MVHCHLFQFFLLLLLLFLFSLFTGTIRYNIYNERSIIFIIYSLFIRNRCRNKNEWKTGRTGELNRQSGQEEDEDEEELKMNGKSSEIRDPRSEIRERERESAYAKWRKSTATFMRTAYGCSNAFASAFAAECLLYFCVFLHLLLLFFCYFSNMVFNRRHRHWNGIFWFEYGLQLNRWIVECILFLRYYFGKGSNCTKVNVCRLMMANGMECIFFFSLLFASSSSILLFSFFFFTFRCFDFIFGCCSLLMISNEDYVAL